MNRRANPLECAASAQTRYALQLNPDLLGKAGRTLSQLAARADASAGELRDALLMLGYPKDALRATQSDLDAAASPSPRDSIGRTRRVTSGVVQDRCRSGKHLMIGSNVGHCTETNRRFCRACRNANLRAKRKGVPQKPREKSGDCSHGHHLSGENLIIIANGARRCRQCITRPKGAYKRGAA